MVPPRAGNSTLTSSFSVTDADNEVLCPLHNQDGTLCRKRCLGEKRYRSMQEHIRRAHPEYYLPKLPATKESFELMITSPPHEVTAPDPAPSQTNNVNNHHISQHSDPSGLSPNFHLDAGLSSTFEGYHGLGQHDGGYYTTGDTEAAAIYNSMQSQQRDEYRRGSLIPAASAAAALAQLHYHRPDSDWGGDSLGQVAYPFLLNMSPTSTEEDQIQTFYSDTNNVHVDPALEDHSFMQDQSAFPGSADLDHSGLLPSSLAHSPPDRTAAIPSMPRSLARGAPLNRPRKSSLSQQARMGKHERKKSKENSKRTSGERATLYGKRWEDLIDAAASATEEEGSRDLTPIPASPYQEPPHPSRTSLPPFAMGSQFHPSFQASPLNRALTPPSAENPGLDLQHFPSVDSSLSSNISHQHHNSAGSGSQFQIMDPSTIDSTSSPMFTPAGTGSGNMSSHGQPEIYCAGCRRASNLLESYACTSCISGLCGTCTDALVQEQSRGRMSACPKCRALDSSFKPFNLELK